MFTDLITTWDEFLVSMKETLGEHMLGNFVQRRGATIFGTTKDHFCPVHSDKQCQEGGTSNLDSPEEHGKEVPGTTDKGSKLRCQK